MTEVLNKMTRGGGGIKGRTEAWQPQRTPHKRLTPHKVLPALLPYLSVPCDWGAALPSSSCSLDELLLKSREKLLCQEEPALLRLFPPDISSNE